MACCVDHLSIACKDGSPLSADSDEDAADPSGAVESGTEEPARKRVKIDVIYPCAVGVRDDPYYAADLVDGAVKWSRIEQNRADAARPAPSMPPPPPPPPGHSIPPPPPPQTPASSSRHSDTTTQVQII